MSGNQGTFLCRVDTLGKSVASIDSNGYAAGFKSKGKERNLLVDNLGLIPQAEVHSASILGGDVVVMATLFGMFPFLRKLYAHGGYQGPAFQAALKRVLRAVDVEIVKRSGQAKGFVALPKRWIVERAIAWLDRCRRFTKDWESLSHKALAFRRMAAIWLIGKKLCNPTG